MEWNAHGLLFYYMRGKARLQGKDDEESAGQGRALAQLKKQNTRALFPRSARLAILPLPW